MELPKDIVMGDFQPEENSVFLKTKSKTDQESRNLVTTLLDDLLGYAIIAAQKEDSQELDHCSLVPAELNLSDLSNDSPPRHPLPCSNDYWMLDMIAAQEPSYPSQELDRSCLTTPESPPDPSCDLESKNIASLSEESKSFS